MTKTERTIPARMIRVIVSEESYEHPLFDWENLPDQTKAKILIEAADKNVHDVWFEFWLQPIDESIGVSDWTVHEIMSRDYVAFTDAEFKSTANKLMDFLLEQGGM